ncbi:MAG: hypothetical protein ACQEXJ_05890 [Myxococcota bacterium]
MPGHVPRNRPWVAATAVILLLSAAACGGDEAGPITVEPAPDEGGEDAPRVADAPTDGGDDARPPWQPPGGDGDGHGVVVETADGVLVGALVSRGSDDSISGRTIYDTVTVFHPDSGLFLTVGMADGSVRLPATVFFSGSQCGEPVGLSAGGCGECRSGYGLGFPHGGTWYRVRGGRTFERTTAGSTMTDGVDPACMAHSVDNAKVFPVEVVTGPTPPTDMAAPLRFAWR